MDECPRIIVLDRESLAESGLSNYPAVLTSQRDHTSLIKEEPVLLLKPTLLCHFLFFLRGNFLLYFNTRIDRLVQSKRNHCQKLKWNRLAMRHQRRFLLFVVVGNFVAYLWISPWHSMCVQMFYIRHRPECLQEAGARAGGGLQRNSRVSGWRREAAAQGTHFQLGVSLLTTASHFESHWGAIMHGFQSTVCATDTN